MMIMSLKDKQEVAQKLFKMLDRIESSPAPAHVPDRDKRVAVLREFARALWEGKPLPEERYAVSGQSDG